MIAGKALVTIYSYLYDIVFMKYKGKRGIFVQPTLRGYHLVPRFIWKFIPMRSGRERFKMAVFKSVGNLLGKAISYYLFGRNRPIRVKVKQDTIDIVPAKLPVSDIYPKGAHPDMSNKQLTILGHKVPVGLVYINGKLSNYVFIPSKRYSVFVVRRLIFGKDTKITGAYAETDTE